VNVCGRRAGRIWRAHVQRTCACVVCVPFGFLLLGLVLLFFRKKVYTRFVETSCFPPFCSIARDHRVCVLGQSKCMFYIDKKKATRQNKVDGFLELAHTKNGFLSRHAIYRQLSRRYCTFSTSMHDGQQRVSGGKDVKKRKKIMLHSSTSKLARPASGLYSLMKWAKITKTVFKIHNFYKKYSTPAFSNCAFPLSGTSLKMRISLSRC